MLIRKGIFCGESSYYCGPSIKEGAAVVFWLLGPGEEATRLLARSSPRADWLYGLQEEAKGTTTMMDPSRRTLCKCILSIQREDKVITCVFSHS